MKPTAERPDPPRLAGRLLRLGLPAEAHEVIAGDLEEAYRRRVRPLRGRLRADLWYWGATLAALRDFTLGARPRRPSPPGTDHPMLDFRQDVLFALRLFRRSPGLVLAVTLTLALGVGANTAIFTVVYGTLVRPLPYEEPDRLVVLRETNAERGWTSANVAAANFLDWQERADSFAIMAVHQWQFGAALTGGDRPQWVRATAVSHGFFELLGAAPVRGRTFTEEDTWSGSEERVVISHRLWQQHFGGDPDVAGETLSLDGRSYVVLGVAEEGFGYPGDDTDVWFSLGWEPGLREQSWFRRAHFLYGLGRLRTGVEVEAAETELQAIAAALESEHPEINAGMGVRVRPLHEFLVGDTRTPLLVLLGAVGAVLLIACANIANLLLARAAGRGHEVAIRAALGAGRMRIARQLLTESLVLAAAGGLAGVAVGYGLTGMLLRLGDGIIPRPEAVGFDGASVAFAGAVVVAAGFAFGLVPALRGSTVAAGDRLREGGRSASASRAASRTRGALIVAEIALALVLVSVAGLMLRSASRLASVDPGFEPEGLLAAAISLPSARYAATPEILGFLETVDERLSARPGIRSVAVSDNLPLEGSTWTSDVWVEGRPIGGDAPVIEFHRRIVSDDYFRTMGIPLLQGRTFDGRDHEDAPQVAIVNETLVRQLFAGESPLGARITDSTDPDEDDWYTVVGVVGAQKLEGLDSREWPEVMLPFAQARQRFLHLLVRYDAQASRPDEVLREELAALDPDLPVISSRTFEEIMTGTMGTERLLTMLLGAFAAMALLLATVGIAGVVSWSVVRRTREIGVRVALGASRAQVIRMLVRQGMGLVALGGAIGLALTFLAGRALANLLYDTSPLDPTTLLGVVVVLGATALLAIWIPARRAGSVDPVRSLQAD